MLLDTLTLPSLESLDTRVRQGALERYVVTLPAVRALARRPWRLRRPVTVLVGDNGAGKSTLVEAIALALEFDGLGGPRFGFNGEARRQRTGTESQLSRYLSARGAGAMHFGGFYLRSETQLNLVLGADTPAGRSGRLSAQHQLSARSHGEVIFDLIDAYMRGPGLYIFDEPESGLSVIRQMALLAEIHHVAEAGGQVIVATHSPILPAIPGADIVAATDAGLMPVDFDEVESVRATREFFEGPHEIAQYLIADPDAGGR